MAQNTCEAPENEIRVVLIGKTGSGKSRTGNVILGIKGSDHKKFEFSSSPQSVTKTCELKTAERFGLKLDVVDTPGVFDTKIDMAETQMEIKNCLLKTSPGPHAILLCVPMERFTDESIKTLDFFVGYFGPKLYEYVVVVFTHLDEWKDDQEDLGIEKPDPEKYIETLQYNLRDFLLKSNNNYCFFDNRLDIADDSQVRYLIKIIESNVNRNKNHCFTNDVYEKIERGIITKLCHTRDEIKQSFKLVMNYLLGDVNITHAPFAR